MISPHALVCAIGLGVGFTVAGTAGCAAAPPPAPAAATPGDADGDGVLDGVDKCPDKKEDGLPPQPMDGCPKS